MTCLYWVNDTLLFSSDKTILHLTSSGRFSTIPGDPQHEDGALKDGQDIFTRFKYPGRLMVDRTGNVVVVDYDNDVIHSVAKEGAGTHMSFVLWGLGFSADISSQYRTCRTLSTTRQIG